ncbi:hypothetical protein [Pseudomonas citri]|uniref:hypothetical protein n=1 Tax=Pseudomonas citri TaxID=2978349 RepID=UPI0021B69B40|nr:hypothetical protein [Pseudomonas citri]
MPEEKALLLKMKEAPFFVGFGGGVYPFLWARLLAVPMTSTQTPQNPWRGSLKNSFISNGSYS